MPPVTTYNYSFPWRDGNRFEVLSDGNHFFPRIIDSINAARRYVLIEVYLVESGSVANRIIQALLDAADRRVAICLLFDDYGAMKFSQIDRSRLIHPNVRLCFYNPIKHKSQLRNLYRFFFHRDVDRELHRDHRKLFIIDGEIAFTGGTGITDAFDPPDPRTRAWRETMIEIHGPVVADWQHLFRESWDSYAIEPLNLPEPHPTKDGGGLVGRVMASEGHWRSDIKRSLLKRIVTAEHRVWIATAYFVPPWKMRQRLRQAARRGVDVRLLLPGPHSDHPAVRHAGRRYYTHLLRHGVRIFEYQPRFLHAKAVLCDNWVSIGSSNFDHWNLRWNLEANQEVEDQNLAQGMQQIFEQDFFNSREFSYEKWIRRSRALRGLEWFWGRIDLILLGISDRIQRRGRGPGK